MFLWLMTYAENIACGALLCFLAAHVLMNLPEIKHELIKKAAIEVAHTIDLWAEVADAAFIVLTKVSDRLEKASEPVEQSDRTAMAVLKLRRRLLDAA
jgi:hypothetical protein